MTHKNIRQLLSMLAAAIVISATGISIAGTEKKTSGGMPELALSIALSEKKCQIAVWITDASGKYIDTVYVSRKTGQRGLGNRGGELDGKLGGSRLSMLPVWAYSRGVDYGNGNFYPPKDQPLPDAVSSATPPAGRLTLTWSPEPTLPAGEYHYYVEVNKSFDDNDYHDYSWYRGQPSVVWRGAITIGQLPDSSHAAIIGHGDPAGAHGNITADVSTLTTALDLIGQVTAVYRP